MFKKGMKKVLALVALLSLNSLFAQQESQYTQYMYNPILINPGYAGSRGVTSIFGIYRNQWLGLDGAPKTTALSAHTPFESKNVGLGLSFLHEGIGPQTFNNIMVDFAYILKFETSKLALGVKGMAGFYDFDKSKIRLYHGNDEAFNQDSNVFYPNVGVGAYWYSDKYYAGLSIPTLLNTKTFKGNSETVSLVNSKQHFYLMGGYVFDFNKTLKFKPAVLFKVVEGAPLQFDASANFMLYEKLVLGAAWRWGAAVSLMAGFQINKNWFIGYAYDHETTDLRKYNSGSHEIFVRYEFVRDLTRIISPRFF